MPFGSSRSLRASAYHTASREFDCAAFDEGDSTARELFGSTDLGSREFGAPVSLAMGVVRHSLRSSTGSTTSAALDPRVSNTVSPKAASLIRELNHLDFASVGLVGREADLTRLQEAYEAVFCSQEEQEARRPLNLILVAGPSGTGKTALVQEFGRRMAQQSITKDAKEKSVLWVSGKFEQHAVRPYAAFTPALAQLVAKIIAQNLPVQERIRQSIGKDLKGLKELIPNIGELIKDAGGSNSSDMSLSQHSVISHQSSLAGDKTNPMENSFHIVKSQKRFIFLLIRFLTDITALHKLVLVLEDVQWMDPASLGLLEAILLEPSLKQSILILCPYRDNEVDNTHSFSQRLASVQAKRHQQSTTLTIDNLPLEAVHSFCTELFNAPNPQETLELAQIVHQKTHGNVFFVIQFLTALRDHNLLSMNLGTLQWTWDCAQIRTSTVVSDNVLALLLEKIKPLPDSHKRILTIGACLGMTLDQVVVDLLVTARQDSTSTQEALDALVQQGLLEAIPNNRFGNPSYCFPHDQIQLAAMSLLEETTDSIPQLHLDMGRILHQAKDQHKFDYDNLLFTIVGFWNEGMRLITDDKEVQLLIQLNYQAGKKALDSSAFEASSQYLRTALDLIPVDTRWTTQYPLSLELHNTLLKAVYSNGDWERLPHDLDIILKQIHRPIQDRSVAYATKIAMLSFKEHNHPAAIELAVQVLGELGVVFRPKRALWGMIAGLLKTKQLLKKQPLETLLDQVELTDARRLLALEVIGSMQSSLYAANPELFMCTVFKTLRWSLKYGVSKYTAKCIGLYGLVEMAMGNCEAATKACKFAEKLATKQGLMDSDVSPISSVYGFVLPWTASLHSCSLEVLKGYKAGINSGDLEFAFINMSVYCFFCYSCGKPLSDLEADFRDYGFQMKQYNMTLQLQFLSLTWQTALNLMGRNDNPLLLSGEVMCQEEMLKAADDDKNPPLRSQVQCHRLQLAVYFGDFELAAKLIGPASKIGGVNPANPIIWRTEFFIGIAAFEMVRRGKTKWKITAQRAMSKVKKWVKQGNVNCVHILHFLQAEELAACGKKDNAAVRTLYNQAIVMSTRSGFRNDAALAAERCGTVLELAGDVEWATDYFKKAYDGYAAMQAYGKIDQLNERKALQPALEISALDVDDGVKHPLDSPTIVTGETAMEPSEPFQ